MFYTYGQNNSGGGFDVNADRGLSHFVIVEANSAEEADARTEEIGVYFDPEYNFDCECCGTRWSPAWGEGDEEPLIYGEDAFTYTSDWKWIKGPEGYVHYLDGRIESIWDVTNEENK